MDVNLTERQQEILNFIRTFHAENDYFPSLREIAANFDISLGTVQTHMDYLKRKGALSWDKGKPRALTIAAHEKAKSLPTLGEATGELRRIIEDFVRVPILGSVSAGPGLLAEENVEDTFSLPRNFMRYESGQVFGLKVKGDSMIGAGIFPNDLVMVRMQPDANHGDIVVALLGDEASVKYFHKLPGRLLLVSANPAYPPREVGPDFRIMGKVVNLMRIY